MPATMVLLQLAGNVVLLLWGLHMVQSGLLRAFGADLRRLLGAGMRNRPAAFAAGFGVTLLLQSSTATGLMAASFAAAGALDLVPALAVMLGANVGTTLIVQLLAFDAARFAPLLLIAGFIAFRRGARTRTRDLGRVGIGLGLMLLALHLLLAAIAPAETAPALRELFTVLTGDPVLAMLSAALLTWAAHSSVATVLLIASLAGAGIVPPADALMMVAGANLGSAINPLVEGTSSDRAAKRLPAGNLANRAVGCAAALALYRPLEQLLPGVPLPPHQLVALFHMAYNVVLAALFLPLLPGMARLLARLLPDGAPVADPAAPHYLDPAALPVPHVAIANAAREALRMADTADTMLRGALEVFRSDDRKLVTEVRRTDDRLDRLHDAIKRYLTAIDVETMDEADARRVAEVLAFTINLEHVGDIIDKNLMEAAAKKIKRRLSFSQEGADEIAGILERLTETARLASAVFMSGDVRSARSLLKEKEIIRDLETRATEAHFTRMRAGKLETMETSALHLDILRDLRRINAHLAAASYPVLDQSGELRPSRLRDRAA